MKKYKNILIVRTDRIGDVVLTTPAIKALKDAWPESKISILVSPVTKELVDGNPNIDEILIDDKSGEHKGFSGFIKLINVIRQKKFDLAVIYHTKKRSNLLCFLSRIPERIGYKNDKFGFLLNHPIVDQRPLGKKHESGYCLDVLEHLGIYSENTELFLPIKEEAELWADQFIHQNGLDQNDVLIAVHPGASDASKRWPDEKFAELIDKMVAQYHCHIIVIGSADVRDISRKIASKIQGQLLDLTGMVTLSQGISILRRCKMLVSNDSGPVHLAAAVQTPVVSIFTRNQPGINPERWRPLIDYTRVVAVPYDDQTSFADPDQVKEEYLDKITVTEVFEAVDALFKLC